MATSMQLAGCTPDELRRILAKIKPADPTARKPTEVKMPKVIDEIESVNIADKLRIKSDKSPGTPIQIPKKIATDEPANHSDPKTSPATDTQELMDRIKTLEEVVSQLKRRHEDDSPRIIKAPRLTQCWYCQEIGHVAYNCKNTSITIKERKTTLMSKNRCLRCLGPRLPGHELLCQARCSKCKGKHDESICTENI